MLIKTVNIDPKVIDLLKLAAIVPATAKGQHGFVLRFPQTADRKIYLKANEVLQAIDGKWNRFAKGHLFEQDPTNDLQEIINQGTLTKERDGYFPTPRSVVGRMLELCPFTDGPWLEPSAGEGHLVNVIIDSSYRPRALLVDTLVCVEKNEARAHLLMETNYHVIHGDFLSHDTEVAMKGFLGMHDTPEGFIRIYMNPPYEEHQDIQHVMHAYSYLAPGGAMAALTSIGPYFHQDQQCKDFRAWLKYINAKTEMLPEASFKDSGTNVQAQLIVIEK